jgi:aminopeptidase N
MEHAMSDLGFGCRCGRLHHAGDFTLSNAVAHYAPDLTLEPVHLDISLRLDIAAASCEAVVTTTVLARADGADQITLHGVDFRDLEVPNPDVAYQYDGREIKLTWKEPLAVGEKRDVTVRYQLKKPSTGLHFSAPTKAVPESPFFAGTDNESERARHWLACVDLPSVRPTLTYHLTSRADLTFLANGLLVSEEIHGEEKTSHWELKQPCPSYLACFAVGEFVRRDDGEVAGVPVASFATRNFTEADLERSFGKTPQIMEWLTTRLDHPFPYPKYYQIALPGIGGAMENISLTTWDDKFVCDASVHRELEWLVDLVNVHEMAHSYFGDLVVCRDFAHAWLKESWATYMQQCFAQECLGEDEGQLEFYDQLQRYFGEVERYVRPIVTRHFVSSWEMYDMHLYPGGACRLRMLRHELGDALFWGGVKKYLEDNAGRAVETEDFRRALEEFSGRSLGKFFDQWLYGLGYPKLKVEFAYDGKTKLGRFTVEQTQIDEKRKIGAFEFPLEIGWVLSDTLETKDVIVNAEKMTFTVAMPTEPTQVRIDPNHHLLHQLDFNPGADKLKAQLKKAGDAIGRIQAGESLAKSAKPPELEALASQYDVEGFWGVRKYWALAMGRVATQQGVEILARWIRDENDPRVMHSLFDAASRLQDPTLEDAISKRLKGDLPHLARKTALMALGIQGTKASLELLCAAATVTGWAGWAQSGAFTGLARTRSMEAARMLLDRVEYGQTDDICRFLAVEALAQAGQYQEERFKEDITDVCIRLLRDPQQRVRRYAMLGLRTLGATRAIEAIEHYGHSLSDQEQVEVQRVIEAIRGTSKRPHADLRSEIESLQAKVRTLEGSLQSLQDRLLN